MVIIETENFCSDPACRKHYFLRCNVRRRNFRSRLLAIFDISISFSVVSERHPSYDEKNKARLETDLPLRIAGSWLQHPGGVTLSDENPGPVVAREHILRMSVEIASAYVAGNKLDADQVPGLINIVFDSLKTLSKSDGGDRRPSPKPAVPVRRSVTPDYIVCLEDGRKLKMLKRHLRTAFNLSPEEYRTRWGLPADYPMVAPNYAKRRSDFARKIGLGRKGA